MSSALKRKWKLATADAPSAYLHADIDQEIFMKLDPESRKYYLGKDPSLNYYLDSRGQLFVKLKKSLYGLKQSGKLWQTHLGLSLEQTGIISALSESCLFQ